MGQQLVLMLFDKVGLGIVLVVVGFLTSRALERYRSRLAFQNEVAKQRVAAIMEASAAIADLELTLRRAALEVAAQLERNPSTDHTTIIKALYKQKRDAFRVASESVREQVERRRVLIGDSLYRQLVAFHNRLVQLSNAAFVQNSPDAMVQIEQQIEAERLTTKHLLEAMP